MENIGDRIKRVRKIVAYKQDKFSESLGVERTYISKIENGKSNPSPNLIKLICEKFQINEDWLKTGNGVMYEKKEQKKLWISRDYDGDKYNEIYGFYNVIKVIDILANDFIFSFKDMPTDFFESIKYYIENEEVPTGRVEFAIKKCSDAVKKLQADLNILFESLEIIKNMSSIAFQGLPFENLDFKYESYDDYLDSINKYLISMFADFQPPISMVNNINKIITESNDKDIQKNIIEIIGLNYESLDEYIKTLRTKYKRLEKERFPDLVEMEERFEKKYPNLHKEKFPENISDKDYIQMWQCLKLLEIETNKNKLAKNTVTIFLDNVLFSKISNKAMNQGIKLDEWIIDILKCVP